MKSHRRSNRTVTGSKYKKDRKKKFYELGNNPTHTKLADPKVKILRVRGAGRKKRMLSANNANILTKDGKHTVAKIKNILENSADRNFARRNIMTKGAVIDTDLGKAIITSRPGQSGAVDAVLL